jgi:hypothetical protein
MQEVLKYIDEEKARLAAAPLFSFMSDARLSPAVRLGFAPCLTPWVMGFADLNKVVFRSKVATDQIQQIINAHTHVDDSHWRMFVKDLSVLGFPDTVQVPSMLRLLWGDETEACRRVVYGLTRLFGSATGELRLVLIESVEAAGAVSFHAATQTAREFRAQTGKELLYFGEVHEALESGHAMGTENVEGLLAEIALTPAQRSEARALVRSVFALFESMLEALLRYAQAHAEANAASGASRSA